MMENKKTFQKGDMKMSALKTLSLILDAVLLIAVFYGLFIMKASWYDVAPFVVTLILAIILTVIVFIPEENLEEG